MFTKYERGAEEEIEEVYRYASGAEQEAEEGVYAYKNGAEQEVWTAIKWMSQMNNTIPNGATVGYVIGTSSGKNPGWAIWYFNGNTGGGSVTYYLDGEFINPTVSFDYDGFFCYIPGSTLQYSSVGKLELYTRTTSGTESYTSAVDYIKVTEGKESYSKTLSGNFNRVGVKFTFQNWGSGTDSYSPQYVFNIYNILIDGKDCLPSEECEM